jgi:hypothetical protein
MHSLTPPESAKACGRRYRTRLCNVAQPRHCTIRTPPKEFLDRSHKGAQICTPFPPFPSPERQLTSQKWLFCLYSCHKGVQTCTALSVPIPPFSQGCANLPTLFPCAKASNRGVKRLCLPGLARLAEIDTFVVGGHDDTYHRS